MDNPNFDWPLGVGLKSLWRGDYRLGSILQIACVRDISVEIGKNPFFDTRDISGEIRLEL
jgi:hypothetical protein